MLKCAFWYRVLHGTEIVRNCYAWDADASKQINTKSLSACDEYASTSNTADSYISTLPIGTHIFRVQTVHADFVDQNKEAVWGYGMMLVFGSMNGYRAILYITAYGKAYIRHYVANTAHYGWMRII